MFLTKLCIPALVYLVFQITHVIVALFDDKYNKALLQLILGVVMVLFLQLLCMRGMSLISWIIVFLPFIFYTYMTMIIYYVFGLDPKNVDLEVVEETGETKNDDVNTSSKISRDALNSILEHHTRLLQGMQEDIDDIANNKLI
jgi:hypothetical protein